VDKDYKHELIIRKCINLANKSNLTHKHGCVLVKNDMIISCGYNYKPHKCNSKTSITSKNSKQLKNDNEQRMIFSTHAEMSAIKRANKKQLTNCDLYVVRIGSSMLPRHKCSKNIDGSENGNGNENENEKTHQKYYLKNSHPCEICSNLIKESGIRRVYYSIDCI